MKKRIFIIMAFIIMALFASSNANASGLDLGVERPYCGQTINVGSAKTTADYIKNHSVLDYDYMLKNMRVINSTGGSSSHSNTTIKFNYNEISETIKSNYQKSANIQGVYKGFNLIGSSSLALVEDVDFSMYSSELFMNFYQYYYSGSQEIFNYSSTNTKNELINNLDSEYINDLIQLSNKRISYSDFFDMYGTHLIASAELGSNLNITAMALSKETNFSAKTELDASQGTSISFLNLFGANESDTFNIYNRFGLNKGKTTVKVVSSADGGNSIGVISPSDVQDIINQWNKSTFNNPYIIGFGKEGLIPLYDLLPGNNSSITIDINEMKREMDKYINSFPSTIFTGDKLKDHHDFSVKFRENQDSYYKITDSGRFNQKMDHLNVFNEIGATMNFIKETYSKCDITIDLMSKTKKSGHKYVFVYSQNDGISIEKLTKKSGTEIQSNDFTGKLSDYTRKSFDFYNINTKDLNDDIWILYGASGTSSDTWYNYDVNSYFNFHN